MARFDARRLTQRESERASLALWRTFTEPAARRPSRRKAHKLKTRAGRTLHALRKQTVEPVFGIILVASHAGKQGLDGQVFIPGCRPTLVIRKK
jgi:hypothetical protein